MNDKELLAKCLEFFEQGYGEIYKQLLIEQLHEHLELEAKDGKD